MLVTGEHRTTRHLERWALAVLLEAGAVRECDAHGWVQDRADPHARARARDIGRDDPPPGVSAHEATAAIDDVLASIGDTCPDCVREAT